MEKEKKTIVLAGDVRFSEQIITTIKSICYHNKNVNIYILNKDFSLEWFSELNKPLSLINCQVLDLKIENETLYKYKTADHISSESSYFRYFIPDLIPEDKVIYLDSDIVVTNKLDELYYLDLEQYYVAAVLDNLALQLFNNVSNHFNAGMLVVNNKLWKKEHICSKALALTEMLSSSLPDGDQGILNILFRDKWLPIDTNNNYMVYEEYCYLKNNMVHAILRKNNEIPLIIHFNGPVKPWLPYYDLPLREHYWFYYKLNWTDIIAQHHDETRG